MRVCPKHYEIAVETLVSRKDGMEYDLCAICVVELNEILNAKPERVDGRKRVPRNSQKTQK